MPVLIAELVSMASELAVKVTDLLHYSLVAVSLLKQSELVILLL